MVEGLVFTNNVKVKCAGSYDITTWRYFCCTVCKTGISNIYLSLSVSSLAALLLFCKAENGNVHLLPLSMLYPLFPLGRKNENACKSVPKTCALLERFPEATGCRRGQVRGKDLHFCKFIMLGADDFEEQRDMHEEVHYKWNTQFWYI